MIWKKQFRHNSCNHPIRFSLVVWRFWHCWWVPFSWQPSSWRMARFSPLHPRRRQPFQESFWMPRRFWNKILLKIHHRYDLSLNRIAWAIGVKIKDSLVGHTAIRSKSWGAAASFCESLRPPKLRSVQTAWDCSEANEWGRHGMMRPTKLWSMQPSWDCSEANGRGRHGNKISLNQFRRNDQPIVLQWGTHAFLPSWKVPRR